MIEVLRPGASARNARVVMFDFDGTLSLIRSGWVHVMVPMMVDTLAALGTGESREALTALVDDYVARLTGKETIYQMMEFAEQIRRRGGTPTSICAACGQ
jgi:phosphoglycolate phosphatase